MALGFYRVGQRERNATHVRSGRHKLWRTLTRQPLVRRLVVFAIRLVPLTEEQRQGLSHEYLPVQEGVAAIVRRRSMFHARDVGLETQVAQGIAFHRAAVVNVEHRARVEMTLP